MVLGGGRFLMSEVALSRGTSLIRNSAPLGPYSRTKHRALWWPSGGWRFLMNEVALYTTKPSPFM